MVTPLEDAKVSNARQGSSYLTITSTKGRRIAAWHIALRAAPLGIACESLASA
jgi:hypothetical protein